jgi:hypothetical protein
MAGVLRRPVAWRHLARPRQVSRREARPSVHPTTTVAVPEAESLRDTLERVREGPFSDTKEFRRGRGMGCVADGDPRRRTRTFGNGTRAPRLVPNRKERPQTAASRPRRPSLEPGREGRAVQGFAPCSRGRCRRLGIVGVPSSSDPDLATKRSRPDLACSHGRAAPRELTAAGVPLAAPGTGGYCAGSSSAALADCSDDLSVSCRSSWRQTLLRQIDHELRDEAGERCDR